jgi:predicted nuclease with TOPRIM domain
MTRAQKTELIKLAMQMEGLNKKAFAIKEELNANQKEKAEVIARGNEIAKAMDECSNKLNNIAGRKINLFAYGCGH